MLILGLDPGSLHTGYGLLLKRGSTLTTVDAGRFSCPKNQALPARLAHLAASMGELLVRHRPDVAVVESPFHGMNVHSLVVLAQARGALLAAIAGHGVEVREYSPAEVKSAVTGNGRADKEQVARMVRLLLSLGDERVLAADATDALALAICCAQRLRMDRLTQVDGNRRA
jgi:crossover junction endodeoxyribonuclease RuvC